ncbi:MAG: hypothetical protein J7K51_01285 [Thermotogae bacterium]|nr:hypothetical protein [Thermotogota bacterium]
MRRITIYILITVFVFSSILVLADKDFDPDFYKGIRPLAMGGAFVGVADDLNSLFYNPAGLSNTPGNLHMSLELQPAVSENTAELLWKLFQDKETLESLNFDDPASVIAYLANSYGENVLNKNYINASGGLAGSLRFGKRSGFNVGVGAGAFTQSAVQAILSNTTIPQLTLKGGVSGIGVGAISMSLGGFSLGLNAKAVRYYDGLNKLNIDRTPITDVNFDYFDPECATITSHHDYITGDLGVLFEMGSDNLSFSLGALLRDVYHVAPEGQEPDIQIINSGNMKDHEVRVGMSAKFVNLKWGQPVSYLLIAGDIDNLFGFLDKMNWGVDLPDNSPMKVSSVYKTLHIGSELMLGKPLSLQFGINQGYLTGGAILRLWAFQFQFATYAQELGATAGSNGDRRYVAKFSFEF